VDPKDIVRGSASVPPAGRLMVEVLNKRSPKNMSDPKSLE
jgi:hypothetical protein